MNTRSRVELIGLSGLFLLALGCGAPYRRAEIPLGEWHGQGTFICNQWALADEKAKSAEQVQYAPYPTELKITAAPNAPAGSVRLDIVSMHGKIKGMDGDRTHLVAQLEPVVTLKDQTAALYRLTKFGVSMDAKAPDLKEGPHGESHATCMVANGQLVLQVHYMEDFVDTFRFRGDLLHKEGSFFPKDGKGLIDWFEELQKKN